VVKGVNKTVIEVNQTGNKFFEKIVLYVTPEYGNLSTGQLIKAAESLSFDFNRKNVRGNDRSFRKRYKKRRKIRFFAALMALFAILCVVLIKIL